jgi:hypothetical protein
MRGMSSRRPAPSGALAEILAKTGELDRILDGRGLSFEPAIVIGEVKPPEPFHPDPPDWEHERLEREQRERAARIAEAQELLESQLPSPKPDPPARSRRSREAA